MSLISDWFSITAGNRVVFWDGHAKGVGTRTFRRFKSLAEAQAFAATLQNDAARTAGMTIRRGTTWRDLCEAWVTATDGKIAEGTMLRRLSGINAWILPTVGETLVVDTTLATLIALADKLAAANTGISNFNAAVQTMSVIAEWAAARNALPQAPFGAVEARQRALKKLRAQLNYSSKTVADEGTETGITWDQVPTWVEVVCLSEAVANRAARRANSRAVGERYGRAVRIAAGTGVRLCELLGLTSDRIDLANGIIRIDRQLDRYKAWDGTGDMPTAPPKYGRKRNIVVWAKVRADLEAAIADAASSNGILFPPSNAQRWWPAAWGGLLLSARADAGWELPGHWLRHHYGSFSLASREVGGMGLPAAEVQHSLGHKNLTTTLETYISPTRSQTGWAE